MLTQERGDKHKPFAYYSTQLDSGPRACPAALCCGAGAELMAASVGWTLGNDIDLQTPHAARSLLNNELNQRFSARRSTSSEILLLSPPKICI